MKFVLSRKNTSPKNEWKELRKAGARAGTQLPIASRCRLSAVRSKTPRRPGSSMHSRSGPQAALTCASAAPLAVVVVEGAVLELDDALGHNAQRAAIATCGGGGGRVQQ